MQIIEVLVNDAFPAAGPGTGDVICQIIDEQAFVRRAIGQTPAVLEKLRPWLADADLVGQHKVIEMLQGAGELPAIVACVEFVGITSQ